MAATADGFIPGGDPFEDVYADPFGNVAAVYSASRLAGNVVRDAGGAAVGGMFWGSVAKANGLSQTGLSFAEQYLSRRAIANTVAINAVELEYGATAAKVYQGVSTTGRTLWTVVQTVQYVEATSQLTN